jgi:hypothetical protein
VGTKIARFDLTKNLEDYSVTLEKIGMAAKWDNDSWLQKAKDAFGELLKEADEALERAREQEATEMTLKIMEGGRDKLVTINSIKTRLKKKQR